jgi:signal transduction histidine kinase
MNIFAITSFITAIASLMLGVFIYLKNKTRVLNKAWFVMSAGVAVWSCFYGIMISTSNAKVALVSARMLNYGAMFIPSSFLHFLFSLIGQDRQRRKLIFSFHRVMGLLLATTLVFPNYLVSGVSPKFGYSYYTVAGPIFLLYFIIWGSLIGYAFILLLLETNKNTGNKRNQLLYTLFASLIGFPCGATTFLSVYMSNIYPWGTSLISFYVLIISYAIVKHHLMDIRLALTKAGIFFAVYALTLGFPFWIFYATQNAYLSLAFAMALAFAGPIVHRRLQFKAEEALLAKQKHYQRFLLQAARGMAREHNLQHLLNLIVHVIKRGVRPQFASAFLFDEEHKRYELKALRDHQHMPDKFALPQEHKLIEAIKQNKKPLGLEDIAGIFSEYSGSPIHLVVPSFSDNKLLGFLALGEKEDHTVYTQDDTNVFSILAQQAAMAIDNCLYMEAAKRNQQRLFEAEKLASVGGMAAGMSHQFKNRLNAFVAASGDVMLCSQYIKEKYAQLIENDTALKENVEFMDKSVELIGKEVKRCNALVQGIVDYARDKSALEVKEISFKEIVDAAVYLVKMKHRCIDTPLPFELITDIPADDKFCASKSHLNEIIFNLLDNAYEAIDDRIRYHSDGESSAYRPQVKVSLAKNDGKVLITVADNGVGIKEEDKASIFAPFFTTKSSAVSGMGLGMYIIKRIIVEQMLGKIWFESKLMQGVTFYVELPHH